jgi:hypothetical protein
MTNSMKRFLYWSPRIICILSAAFISIFAMDVFDEGRRVWETLLTLMIHLIPTFALVLTLIIAWRWEIVGGIVFNVLGILYLVSIRGLFNWTATC